MARVDDVGGWRGQMAVTVLVRTAVEWIKPPWRSRWGKGVSG